MKRLNVGCGSTYLEGYVNLDGPWNPTADVRFDLETCFMGEKEEKSVPYELGTTPGRLPFSDNTFDELLMVHTIEHIKNLLPLMQELYRVAKPGALLGIRCPHGASDDADEDPTHVRRLFPRSFSAFGQPYYYKADYGYTADWRCDAVSLLCRRARLAGRDQSDTARILSSERNVVLEMVAELFAVKPARPRKGLVWPQIKVELV